MGECRRESILYPGNRKVILQTFFLVFSVLENIFPQKIIFLFIWINKLSYLVKPTFLIAIKAILQKNKRVHFCKIMTLLQIVQETVMSLPQKSIFGKTSNILSCLYLNLSTRLIKIQTILACSMVFGNGTAKYRGRWARNQWCCCISGMVILFIGSTISILGIKSLAPADKWLGRVYMPCWRKEVVNPN